jgi:hypothetical protein
MIVPLCEGTVPDSEKDPGDYDPLGDCAVPETDFYCGKTFWCSAQGTGYKDLKGTKNGDLFSMFTVPVCSRTNKRDDSWQQWKLSVETSWGLTEIQRSGDSMGSFYKSKPGYFEFTVCNCLVDPGIKGEVPLDRRFYPDGK